MSEEETTETEAYLELYKKYPPKTWGGLIGQTKVAKSLRSAVANHRLPVAYAFFGPRGCGKTSAAKLLAKAINCENPPKPGDPCNQCATCKNITANVQLGVQYISMANRGKADDVRQIVEQARLAQPVNKVVYILDEVHNLHAAAWDALLIPLESDTQPALFILCSTEAHKIPETIMSRVQARSFSLVTPDVMKAHVEKILTKEKIDLNDASIEAAIREGRGSVRDTLSRLEGIIQTGEVPTSFGSRLLEAISDKKLSEILKVTAEFSTEGGKAKHLAEQLYADLRDILLLVSGAGPELVPVSPVNDAKKFVTSVGKIRGMTILIETLGDAITNMSVGSAEHRILFEVALFKSISKIKSLASE